MSEFSEQLSRYIEESEGLTVTGVARAAGLDASAIRKMIKDGSSPRVVTMNKILRVLGFSSYDEFMKGGQDPASELVSLIGELTEEERQFLVSVAKVQIATR